MYYVIKKQHTVPPATFISFHVLKYIASKNNESVIFEFQKNGKALRKWVKKEELNNSIKVFSETMQSEIDKYNGIKDSSDILCILRDL